MGLGVGGGADPSFTSRCLFKNEPILLYLTDFYFHRNVCKQKKYLEKFDSKSVF